MPQPRVFIKVRITTVLHLIARYELQQNKASADALRALLRHYRIHVDEGEIRRIIIEQSS